MLVKYDAITINNINTLKAIEKSKGIGKTSILMIALTPRRNLASPTFVFLQGALFSPKGSRGHCKQSLEKRGNCNEDCILNSILLKDFLEKEDGNGLTKKMIHSFDEFQNSQKLLTVVTDRLTKFARCGVVS
ncbi:hypothetical protein M8J76_014002 [Diaphorina citri]|nr:hypothetical protein M8J75_007179 [Diaphorina citri]KAI5723999.1 hypothetical protein M8J76_014002 [Diaphorina citri]